MKRSKQYTDSCFSRSDMDAALEAGRTALQAAIVDVELKSMQLTGGSGSIATGNAIEQVKKLVLEHSNPDKRIQRRFSNAKTVEEAVEVVRDAQATTVNARPVYKLLLKSYLNTVVEGLGEVNPEFKSAVSRELPQSQAK